MKNLLALHPHAYVTAAVHRATHMLCQEQDRAGFKDRLDKQIYQRV